MIDLHKVFKEFCKETKRSGGVLVGSSIKEFINYIHERYTIIDPNRTVTRKGSGVESNEEDKENDITKI